MPQLLSQHFNPISQRLNSLKKDKKNSSVRDWTVLARLGKQILS